jgi:cysteine desulfurase
MHGAGHQGGRRAGTEPVALIVGLGAAAHAAKEHLASEGDTGGSGSGCRTSGTRQAKGGGGIRGLRDHLWDGLHRALGDGIVLLGHPTLRLPNTLCVGFRGKLNSEILAHCPDVCASMGAACHSGQAERSATLAAMNVPEEVAFGAIRFSVGKFSTQREVDEAVKQVSAAVLH